MKMKRYIAGLLSLIMVISMIGVVDVNAAETTESTYGELLAEGLTEGIYIDDSANANEDYVYTIIADDGSVAEVSTNTMDNVEEGYWKVQWEDETLNMEDGEYLIVSAGLEKHAVKSVADCPYGTFDGSKSDVFISTDKVTDEFKWNISKSDNGYMIESVSNAGYYMKVKDPDQAGGSKPVTIAEIAEEESKIEIIPSKYEGYMQNTVWIKHNGGYLNQRGNQYVGTWTGVGTGDCFYLYKKGYRVSDTAIAEATAGIRTSVEYASGWAEYREALLSVYFACDTAAQASAKLENIIERKAELKVADTKRVFVKCTGSTLPTDGNYLIVTQRMENYALGNTEQPETAAYRGNWHLSKIAIADGKTTQVVDAQHIWNIKATDSNGYYIKNEENGKYIDIGHVNASGGLDWSESEVALSISSAGQDLFRIFKGNGYMNCEKQNKLVYDNAGMCTYSDPNDQGNNLYLYKEVFYVTELAIEEVESSVTGTEDTYTATTWNTYQEALNATKVEFVTKAEAENALATLREAAENLSEIDESVLEAYYVKKTPKTSTPMFEDGIYAIVGAHYDNNQRYSQNKVIRNDGTFTYTDLGNGPGQAGPDNIIEKVSENELYEWEFKHVSDTNTSNTYSIQSVSAGTYMSIDSNRVTLQENSVTLKLMVDERSDNRYNEYGGIIIANSNNKVLNHKGDNVGVWDYRDGDSDSNNNGSIYYLFLKQYAVSADVIAKIEASIDTSIYSEDTVAVYNAALEAARTVEGTASQAYEAYEELISAKNSLVLVTEHILPAEDDDSNTEEDDWTWNDLLNAQGATLTVDEAHPYDKTDEAIKFELTTATGFEVLAACSANTGMLMTVVKDADGNNVKGYLVDTYYPGTGFFENVPVVRDMASPLGGSVEVYGCLVASTVGSRVPAMQSTFSVQAAKNAVSKDDIVFGLLQELGLDEELSVSDIEVSYMDESSVLNGGQVQGTSPYALSLADTSETATSTTNNVYVGGCRLYRAGNGVAYTAVSDLVTGGNAGFIQKDGESFVLSEYQKTGPQNEIYLAQNESIVIGLAAEPTDIYQIRVKENGVERYDTLIFEQSGEGYVATITNTGDNLLALGVIKCMSTEPEIVPATFMLTSAMTEALLAVMNAPEPTTTPVPTETPEPTTTPVPTTPVENPFDDVAESEFYYEPVLWAVKNNITNGVNATQFKPDAECSRAEIVTFLWRSFDEPEAIQKTTKFVDLGDGEFYEDAVLWAVEKEITNGVDDTHFAPNQKCTRAEIVTFLWRAFDKPEATQRTTDFVDLGSGEFYEDAVLWAVEKGITNGVDNTHFEPNGKCLRGQAVTFLYRVMAENE